MTNKTAFTRRGGPPWPPVSNMSIRGCASQGQARRPVPTGSSPVGSMHRITKSGLFHVEYPPYPPVSGSLKKPDAGGIVATGKRAISRLGILLVIPAKAGIHFMIFAFVFAFGSDSREGAPRPNPERMRRIYMAASVSSSVGRESVRAKSQRQRQKWIPAFAGMTGVVVSRKDVAGALREAPVSPARAVRERPLPDR